MSKQGNGLPPGYVAIHDRPYKTVAKRVEEFWSDRSPAHWGITTEILHIDADIVRVKASIVAHGVGVCSTGHAEENRLGGINLTSAVENAETSAIGRALAALGYGGSDTEFASADEMVREMDKRKMMEEGKLSPVKLRKYVEGMREAVEKEDGPGMLELVDELSNEQQLFVWGTLQSWERSAIKKLIAEARAAQ